MDKYIRATVFYLSFATSSLVSLLLEDAKKQEKKKKKKKEDDDDDIGASKPDTFTEKLVTNLLKNLIVS